MPPTRPGDEPSALPTELSGEPTAAPAAATGGLPEPQPRESTGGLSLAVTGPDGFTIASSFVDTRAIAGIDELPLGLSIPTLLAILSIVVLAAGVGRLQLAVGRTR